TDLAVVLFSSGSTGVSKGCLLSHRHAVRAAEASVAMYGLTADDVYYTPYPLHHVTAAHYEVLPCLLTGARAVVAPRFSASRFWSEIKASEATIFSMMGSVNQILWSAPESSQDRDHAVRLVSAAPLTSDREAFESRFGVRLVRGAGAYGSTDVGCVAVSLED